MKKLFNQLLVCVLLSSSVLTLSASANQAANNNATAAAPAKTTTTFPSCGYVVMQFDIDEQGHPVNIKAIDSQPAGRYSEEAIKALAKWQYAPRIEQGKAVIQKDRKVRLEFNLPQC